MKRCMAVLCWLGVVAVLGLAASDALARGGRGGGGGGGGFSRGGPARSGSFGTSRVRSSPGAGSYSRTRTPSQRPAPQPSTRPATRPSTQPATRPAQPAARPSPQPGTRPAERPAERPSERPTERPDGSTENREDWQNHREDMQKDRQKQQDKSREDWQEWGDKHHDDWDEVDWDEVEGIVVIGDDELEWDSADFLMFSLGTALTVSAFQSLYTGSDPACTMTSVLVNDQEYYRCGPSWYVKGFANGEVTYVVVTPPPGY